MSSTDSSASTSRGAGAAPSTDEQMQLVVSAAEDRKAEDIRVFDLARISDFTDQFLICSGASDRQVQAIADRVLERLRSSGVRPLHVEGYDRAAWVLIDFGGDLVVHVFQPQTRAFYALERLWSDAPEITERFTGPPRGGEAAADPE